MFNNQIKFLTSIDNLQCGGTNTTELDGWIYDKSGHKWTIYFKELGFVRVKMWDFKFEYLIGDLHREKILEKKVGDKIKFSICRKTGFLPKEKILIVPLLDLI